MAKGHLRWSAASGTAKQKVLRILARGWEPGLAIGKVLESRKRKRQQPHASMEGGCHLD
jgi:hypothetical protein